MINYLSAAIGGAVGTIIRFGVDQHIGGRITSRWPLATFLVNVFGCFLIGWFAVSFEKTDGPKWLQIMLITGICGGLTTFSTLVLEMVDLMQSQLYLRSILYLMTSVVAGLIAIALGIRLASSV